MQIISILLYNTLHTTFLFFPAYGPGLSNGTVGTLQNIKIISRDKFQNLVPESMNYPTMFAVGPEGTVIRGNVQDNGDGTYDIQYLPKKSGLYEMFISIGCCAPHQVGYCCCYFYHIVLSLWFFIIVRTKNNRNLIITSTHNFFIF